MCLALIEMWRQKETKKEKSDGRRRERAEDEVDRSFCPSRCQRQIIVLTLSELLRPCAAPRPSPDYSLVRREIAAASSTSSSLCPSRETDFQPTSDHLNKTRKRGGRSERGRRAAGARSRLKSGLPVWPVSIKFPRARSFKAVVDEIETKPPSRPTISRWRSLFSFAALSLSLTVFHPSQERPRNVNSKVDPKENPLERRKPGACGDYSEFHVDGQIHRRGREGQGHFVRLVRYACYPIRPTRGRILS